MLMAMVNNPFKLNGISHCYQLDPSFSVLKGCWIVFYIFIQISIEHSVSKQQRPILRCLIWVCTVFLCPTKRTLGLYGLIITNNIFSIFIALNGKKTFNSVLMTMIIYSIVVCICLEIVKNHRYDLLRL